MQILGPQNLAQRDQIGHCQKCRQFVPDHEQIEELEELDIENHHQRFRVVLAGDDLDKEAGENGDRHQHAE